MSDIAFSGSIPEFYDSGLGPVMFEPYAVEVASRLRDLKEGAVLEIACGTGRVTRQLRKSLSPKVSLVASDLSESMLAFARSHSPGEIEWRVVDAQDLSFKNEEFDALVCQFGMMFVPDRPLAVREFRRVLKPDGRALVFVWDRMERLPLIAENHKLLLEYFPIDPPQFLEVPFSMSDPDETRDLFEASFKKVTVERIEKQVRVDDPLSVAKGCILGNPIASQIAERDPEAPAKLISLLTDRIAKNRTVTLSALLVTASN